MSRLTALLVALAALTGCNSDGEPGREAPPAEPPVTDAAPAEAAGPALEVPPGFRIEVFHEGVGERARHMVVRENGDVLVARRDGTLVALRDADGDGRAERMETRPAPVTTGIELHGGYVYLSDETSVSRIALEGGAAESPMPAGPVETVVGGFPEQGQHAAKTLAFDAEGRLYVNVGAPSNACQEESRTPGSPGMRPCPQLERQAGIWRFPASATGLEQADGEHHVTGTRNVLALDWNPDAGALFFVMHGRDQLRGLWSEHFDAEDNARMPAEELHRVEQGADYGWPYTFYDGRTGRRLVAPEYGGDGERTAEPGRYPEPLHAFPAHWAPNDMVFAHSAGFPEAYRRGAFVSFHGSWNRAPKPQAGYRVSFVPFDEAGGVAGDPLDFVTGFTGQEEIRHPGEAQYRPMGLALGPDGALYVGETVGGRIWRVLPEG